MFMKVYAHMWCHVKNNGTIISETLKDIYFTAQSAIKAAESLGYIEQINKTNAYDDFCVWISEEKPLLHTEGASQVYIAEYELKS